MGDLVAVHAGWAIWSKHPGTRDDYSVLVSSAGPLSTAEFTSVLAHFAPGNPPAERDTPASLPWVTLSRVGVAEQTYLGVSLQVPTEHVDATGRPISQTGYICVPYDDLTREPVSYADLAGALEKARLPQQGGGLIQLTAPRLAAADLARTVMDFGSNVVASTAALLLSGPVTITGPDFPDWQTRLRFLDAVAALLPYGYRASYTAATWSDGGAGPRFRLVFASRPGDKAFRVAWGASARIPAESHAAEYLRYLHRVTGKSAVDATELAGLIGFLSSDTQPRKFERPEDALTCIAEYFRAAVVGEIIDAGNATATDIRRLFRRGQDGQLSPSRRRTALGILIAFGDPQDWPQISERFDAIVGGDVESMLPAISQVCQRLLWSPAAKDLIRRYVELMTPYALADELLARLMAPPKFATELENGSNAAGALLAEFVMADPASYPQTQQALVRNPVAGAALLAHLCASRGQAGTGIAVEWLEPVLDRILPPFNAVLGEPPEPVTTHAVDSLRECGNERSVRYLLRAASYLGRLHLVLPALATWLAWEAMQPAPPDRRFWNDAAMELTPASVADAAWLDLALLATGNDPRSLFADNFPSSALSQSLAAAWRELTAVQQSQGQAVDDLLTGALIDFLGRREWRGDQQRTAAVEELTRLLTTGGARPRLKTAVLDPAEALRYLTPQATPADVARILTRAYADGLYAEQAGRALAESGIIASGAQVADILERLHLELADRRNAAYKWQQTLAMMAASGTFGGQIAADFSVLVVRNSRNELAYHLRLLNMAARTGIDGAPPALTHADIDFLDRACGFIEEILRDARKREGGFLGRNVQRFASRKDAKGGAE